MRTPIDLFKGSWAILQNNLMLFVGILLVPIVVSVIVQLFAPSQATGVIDTMEWTVYVGLMLISAVINILMAIALILAIDNGSLTVKSAYRESMKMFWSYLGLTIVSSVILFVGFLLLIIPGIILSIWLAFSTFILVLERAGIKESLVRSREYVRGRWWAVFGRIIAIAIVLIVISMIISSLLVVIPSEWLAEAVVAGLSMMLAPLGMGYMYLMYQDVSGHATAPSAEPAVAPLAQ